MRKLWYYLYYGLCAFTIVFSLYWMATMPPRSASSVSPSSSSSSSTPSLRAGNSLADVPQETQQEGYYLCDEGGRLAVYRCGADGKPTQRLELTEIYVNLLPEPDALRIKQGLVVWGDQELASLLEDLGN